MTDQQIAGSSAIAQDVPCINCGYNLRGLNTRGVCPECATSIAVSLSERIGKVSTTTVIWARCMVVGLVAWVLLSGLALTQLRFSTRGDGSSRVIKTNYPGPKLWITNLRPPYVEQASNPDAYGGITYALGCLIIAYLLTSPQTSYSLESAFSLRRIARWCSVVGGAAVVGQEIGYFDWGWTDVTENAIPVVATVLLYVHLAGVAKDTGLKAEARTLQLVACIAGTLMVAAIPPRYFEYDPSFRSWTNDSRLAALVFSTYSMIAIIGAVLAAGTMIRLALAILPMAQRRRIE